MSSAIFNHQQIKAWDEFTIQNEPIQPIDLMERAATLATKQILATNLFNSVSIFCGVGNNGGDGLVIARILHQRGINVVLYIVDFSTNHSTEFIKNQKRLPKEIPVQNLTEKNHRIEIKSDLVIDAIFGSGLNKEIDGWISEIVADINKSNVRTVAIDIPSGLFCLDNRNNSLKNSIRANQTVSFQSPKLPFLFSDYAEFVGDFRVINIGLSSEFKGEEFATYITKSDVKLNERTTFSHKGKNGYLTIIAGFENYFGAAILSSKAAFRAGCGYVGTHCEEKAVSILLTSIPECIYIPEVNAKFPAKTTAIAIGPGLGKSHQSLQLLEKVIRAGKPLVVDADALNLLSENKDLQLHLPANCILTPHLKELERLIGKFDRPEELLEKQLAFSIKHKVFILQKGAYSKLTTPDAKIFINSSGNAGMASAGMGDVLTGIIGSFLAQGYSAQDAAINGMFIHGFAADLVKRKHGERGMIASDVVDMLPNALNAI